MLEPAILYKNEITKAFASKLYTQDYLWYEGSIENYEREIHEEADKFQFAITYDKQIIGFISFRVDWYCSCVYNFGLIKFSDTYLDKQAGINKNSQWLITSAVREVIKMIESFNQHRIDFRCIGGNPAENGYDKIVEKFSKRYSIRKVNFKDNIKDRQGKYHDTIMYELIQKDVMEVS